jgi:glycosyltransferase involved in cell wall biosynthesis
MEDRFRRKGGRISVCALVPYPADVVPSQRYRIEQWAPHLAEHGITVDLLPAIDQTLMRLLHKPGHSVEKLVMTLGALPRRIREALSVRSYDAVLVHRAATIAGPALIERIVKRLGRPLVFDFDDAIYLLHTSNANRRLGWLKFPRKTELLCRMSDHVVVGNSYLAAYARQHNHNVTVIPTSVDLTRYHPVDRRTEGRIVVGWTGSSTSQTHLEMFAPMLADIASRSDIEIRVLSDRKPSLPGVDFTWRPWSVHSEVDEMAAFNIGIMPMPDDEWARGKCSLKALLYMAMGIPAVCSPVGANREIIRHGENGLLAACHDEWIKSISALADDPALRVRLGRAGRQTVEQEFSARRSASLLAGVIRDAVQQGPLVQQAAKAAAARSREEYQ